MSSAATSATITDEDSRATGKLCRCQSEDWCPAHDRVCPCSDSDGRCRRICALCLGGATVNVHEAALGECDRCYEAKREDRRPTMAFRGLGGVA